MTSIRRLSSLTICVCLLMSVCPPTSASSSLWGKKLQFKGLPCLWQLHPEAVVPALKELSVCMLIKRSISTKWTGFVYKAPGERRIELGLEGTGEHLTAWLFGEELKWAKKLEVLKWYSVCLTWSGQSQRLRIYVNGTPLNATRLHPNLPQHLSPNGTLTIGVSHHVNVDGDVKPDNSKSLVGEISVFRMWDREWSAEELKNLSCAEGDVVSWDLQQWKYDCAPVLDNNLHCAWSHYKINMEVTDHSTNPGCCSVSLEEITRHWLGSIFSPNVSVHSVLVSSPSQRCHVVNDSAALHAQELQEWTVLNSTSDCCFSCEAYIHVNPATDVQVVQSDITRLLSTTFFDSILNMTVDPDTISVLPVEFFPVVTKLPPTVSTKGVTSSGEHNSQNTDPTQHLPVEPTDVSTTRDPLDFNQTAVGPDTFFRVNVTLTLTGSPAEPESAIEKWLVDQLEVNDTMSVLNLIVRENVGRNVEHFSDLMTSIEQQKQYYCIFHVQEYNIYSVSETENLINAALMSKYEDGSTVIQTIQLRLKHIVPENCPEETTSTIYGQYIWPEAFPQVNQEIGCRKPRSERAYRLCKLDPENDTTSWGPPNFTNCQQVVMISDLDNVTVTTGNAAEVVDIIQDLVQAELSNNEELSSPQLDSVMEKLGEVVDISLIQPAVGAGIVDIVANILLSKTNVSPVANTVLNLTDRMGHNVDFQDKSMSLTAPSLALSMVNVNPNAFSGLTFGVTTESPTNHPQVFVSQRFESDPLPYTNATISLPSALDSFFPPGVRNSTRVQFQFYGTGDLFQDPWLSNATQSSWTLNSFIVSASINDSHVVNLEDRVVVTFRHQNRKRPEDEVQCMFWDFQKNGGQGGWNSSGCVTQSISCYQTSCLCNHLTHFAVLLDVSRTPISGADSRILTVISYLGCGVSSIFLGITLLTYLLFEKLRRDYPSKILINLSAALLGLSMLFLLDSWLSSFSNYGLCIVTAATLHYFLLASFTWMGLEAVHMYLALVKVFNTYVPSYILKFCAVGWGLPLVIVGLVLAIDKDAYGNSVPKDAVVLQSNDPFCWLQDDIFFYVTVVAFVLLVLLCNIAVFTVVLIQIRKMRANKPSSKIHSSLHDLRAVASLTVLLGLTWLMGFFSFGPGRIAMMYLFSIFNTMQGFFVFLFHCLMKENVRKQWRAYLCCGRFRLSDYSDWSRSMTVGGRKKNLVNSDSVSSENTSSTNPTSGP
ncbi:adhesion G-protein coupled receptor G4 isoform X2 [Parambassis ranga]|uniref:Adhesion G-protein coupled receptor G4 isoform X2 n=1 Tax=Parambassis ranga TaxID=210632 RepID=A0A6P7J4N5_9TELE|nr:adhesion G-protein coupled receptor G4-like isoform X2 [Parambassis ranga]